MRQGWALITGASSGIGRELAYILAKERYDLVLVARRKALLEGLKNELKKLHPPLSVEILPYDLAKPETPARIFKELKRKKIRIQFLVNNAGFGTSGPFAEANLQRELELIDVNIRSLVELTHLLIPDMLRYKEGIILNVASTAAFLPGSFMANYYASKAYVLHFSEALAEELRPYGVKVSALCPGPTATEFFEVAGSAQSLIAKGKLAPLMSAKEVAEIGYRSAVKGKVVVIAGFTNKVLIQLVRLSPRFLLRKITALLNKPRERTRP
ncbi:MAG: SDR family oxidoreductase [Leptospiraceae bacterium]|nr:SDR family oxidoreductase [Leptospiraceae bacterium]MDW8306148.1 SDR family oxidoreductase [Leptospiraceae bacterium]